MDAKCRQFLLAQILIFWTQLRLVCLAGAVLSCRLQRLATIPAPHETQKPDTSSTGATFHVGGLRVNPHRVLCALWVCSLIVSGICSGRAATATKSGSGTDLTAAAVGVWSGGSGRKWVAHICGRCHLDQHFSWHRADAGNCRPHGAASMFWARLLPALTSPERAHSRSELAGSP